MFGGYGIAGGYGGIGGYGLGTYGIGGYGFGGLGGYGLGGFGFGFGDVSSREGGVVRGRALQKIRNNQMPLNEIYRYSGF